MMNNVNFKKRKLEDHAFVTEVEINETKKSGLSIISEGNVIMEGNNIIEKDIIMKKEDFEKKYIFKWGKESEESRIRREYVKNNKDKILMEKLSKEIRKQLTDNKICLSILEMIVDDNKENVTLHLVEWLYEQISELEVVNSSVLKFEDKLEKRIGLFIFNYPVTEKDYKCYDYYDKNDYNPHMETPTDSVDSNDSNSSIIYDDNNSN